MFKELVSEDIIDISMFIKEKGVGVLPDCKFLINSFFYPQQFQVRLLRKAFFDGTMVAYGDYLDDELTDLLLIDYREENKCCMTIMLINGDDLALVEWAVKKAFEDQKELEKIKVSVTKSNLDSGLRDKLRAAGFEEEMCERAFTDDSKSIYTYSYFN